MDRYELFTLSINNLARLIIKIKSAEMKSWGLKSPHVSCLYFLYKSNEPITLKQLCQICQQDKGAMSRNINFLERNDFVICKSKTPKPYNSPLILTKKGEEIGKFISNKIDTILNNATKGLTNQEKDIMYRCLDIISNNLSIYYTNINKGEENGN